MKTKLDEKEIRDKGERLDKQFEELLNTLRNMPKDTKEEREARFAWMKNQPEYHLLVIESMKEWKIGSYDKLRQRLQDVKYENTTFDYDDGIVFTHNKEKDPLVFMEAVRQTVESYTGVDKNGNIYTFLQSIGLKYKQQAFREAGKNDIQKEGYATEINSKRLSKVLKLVRDVNRLCITMNNFSNIEKMLQQCVAEDEKSNYTNKEVELAKSIVEGLSVLSIDTPIAKDGAVAKIGDSLKMHGDDYAKSEVKETINCLCSITRDIFEEKWEWIVDSTGKKDRELLSAFLSKDILIGLKLESVSEEMQKKYKELLEPKCGQWCPRKECMDKKKDGCYIRYGDIAYMKEMGDRELYQILEQMGDSFYKIIFDNAYIKRAYIEDVQNYYDLFSKKLKPAKAEREEERFLFTDTILGNAIGKSKSSVSKARMKYKEITKPMLYQIYQDIF